MANLEDMEARIAQHICIYGEPKTGKSTLAAGIVKAGFKLLWISIDGGHSILFKLPKELRKSVRVIVLPDTTANPIAIVSARKIMSGRRCEVCDAHGIVDCASCRQHKLNYEVIELNTMPLDTIVVWDHVSQIASSAISAIRNRETAKMQPDLADAYKLDYDNWALLGNLMDNFFFSVQQAPYHIICIAHVVETKLEDGTKKLVPQIGTDRYSRNASKFFDHVIYCSMGNKQHNFGSSSTYNVSAISGSRADVAIEQQKNDTGKEITLAPFFDQKILATIKAAEDAKVATVLIESQKEVVKLDDTKTNVVEQPDSGTNREVSVGLPVTVSPYSSNPEQIKARLAALKGQK